MKMGRKNSISNELMDGREKPLEAKRIDGQRLLASTAKRANLRGEERKDDANQISVADNEKRASR